MAKKFKHILDKLFNCEVEIKINNSHEIVKSKSGIAYTNITDNVKTKIGYNGDKLSFETSNVVNKTDNS